MFLSLTLPRSAVRAVNQALPRPKAELPPRRPRSAFLIALLLPR